MYAKFTSVSDHICNGLFSIGKYGFRTIRMTSFCKLFGRYQDPERMFHNSNIIHVPRTHNTQADCLAHSDRKQPSFVIHMDAELPV